MSKEKEEAFIEAMKEVMIRYGVSLQEYTNYGDDEQYVGSDYIFEGEGIFVYINELK